MDEVKCTLLHVEYSDGKQIRLIDPHVLFTEEDTMLVLTRRTNEVLVFQVGDHEFSVIVTAIRGNRVQIGIEADQEVRVRRAEIEDETH